MTSKLMSKKYTVALLASVLWFCVWPFTPGLLSWNIGELAFSDVNSALIASILFAIVILGILYKTHSHLNQSLFKRHWSMWLYVLPVVALLAIPFRVAEGNELIFGLPPWLYIVMISTSVLMQQYSTFGLLQSYLAEAFRPWLAVVITALLFYLGHALFLPSSFAPIYPLNALFIFALGVVFASIRYKTTNLHATLALHWFFYFIMIG